MAEVPPEVPIASTQDVRICTWNCKGIPSASFRMNLYTLRTMAASAVIDLTETRASQRNAHQLFGQVHGLNYFYTKTLGFVGGVFLLWDMSKVFQYGFNTEPYHVSFIAKVKITLM